jgi:hypothetical protein
MPLQWKHHLLSVCPGEAGSPVAVSALEQVLTLGRAGQPEAIQLNQIHLAVLGAAPMPDTALAIDALWLALEQREESVRKPALIVETSGAGMLLARLLSRRMPIGIMIVAGTTEGMVDGLHRVPRRTVGGELLLMAQTNKFRTARTLRAAGQFREALAAFKLAPPSTAGDDMLTVLREAAADRLVLAAGAACWWAARDLPGPDLGWQPPRSTFDHDPWKAAGL